jgi:hypothetical protein
MTGTITDPGAQPGQPMTVSPSVGDRQVGPGTGQRAVRVERKTTLAVCFQIFHTGFEWRAIRSLTGVSRGAASVPGVGAGAGRGTRTC